MFRLCIMFEKKTWAEVEKVTQENPSKSKIDSKKAKTKNSFLQPDSETLKSIRPKSKSSCLLETIDLSVNDETGETSKTKDFKITKKKEQSLSLSNKKVSEKIKKNKSLDQFEKLYSENLSKSTLANKVSNVLQQAKNPKTSSYLDLLNAKRKTSNERKTLFPNILDNYSTKPNFFNCNQLTKIQSNAANGQMMPGKSISFDSLKVFNKSRQLSKCFSVENGKNIKPEKPIGVFNVHKKSYSQTPEAFTKIISFNSQMINKKNYSNQGIKPLEKCITIPEILKSRIYQANTAETSSDSKIPQYQNYSSRNEKRNIEYYDLESFLKNAKPCYQALDLVRKYNVQDAAQEKKAVKICQCLHFHTEDGFKKLTLQNNTDIKEFGQKFFRVNYFSKKDDESNEQMDSEVKLVDKETTTEDKLGAVQNSESGKSKHSVSRHKTNQKPPLNKKILTKLKTISKNSLKGSGRKQEKTRKKESKNDAKLILWRNENQIRILGEPKIAKKKDATIGQKDSTETKAKRQAEAKERRKSEKPLVKLQEIAKEKAAAQKTLQELEVLEKLFLKLNSVESSLIRNRTPTPIKNDKKIPEDKKHSNKKEKTNSQNWASKECLVLAENEAEEKFRRLRNKLRNAIIRHVQNFLKLDFNDK